MSEWLKTNNSVFDVRYLGTILAIELKQTEGSSYYSQIRDEIVRFFLEKGIFIRPLGNIFFFNPPYCITDDELEKVKKVTIDFLTINNNRILQNG